jgi:hypothetical protein
LDVHHSKLLQITEIIHEARRGDQPESQKASLQAVTKQSTIKTTDLHNGPTLALGFSVFNSWKTCLFVVAHHLVEENYEICCCFWQENR